MLSEILNSIPLDHHMLQILNLVIANPLLKRIKKILNYLSNLQCNGFFIVDAAKSNLQLIQNIN